LHAKYGLFSVKHLHITRWRLLETAHHNRCNAVTSLSRRQRYACWQLRRKWQTTLSSALSELALRVSRSYFCASLWVLSKHTGTTARIMDAHKVLLCASCHLLPIRVMHSGVKIGAIQRRNTALKSSWRVPAAGSTTSSTLGRLGAARSTGFLLRLEEGLEGLPAGCREMCQYQAMIGPGGQCQWPGAALAIQN
jgi:hypothetical protein